LKIKFGDRKIIGNYGYERVCNKSYGELRTFMQNNPACKTGGGTHSTTLQSFQDSVPDWLIQYEPMVCFKALKNMIY
jgi:hypothetical protein